MDSIERLNKVREEIENLKKQAKEKVLSIFGEEKVKLFEKHSCLVSFFWTQYTPYFNDGDACTFSSGHDYASVIFKNPNNVESTDPYHVELGENEYYAEESCGSYCVKYMQKDLENIPGAFEALKDINAFLDIFESEDMLEMFGDHACVVVNKDGVDTQEYEHD